MDRISKSRTRGFTLIEMIIAVTLVAALATGMLYAMRTGLLTLDKTQSRFVENRRVMGTQQLLHNQIAGMIPLMGECGEPVFRGNSKAMRFLSLYSLEQGYRGDARIVEYAVRPAKDRGWELTLAELPFTGPASEEPFCRAPVPAPLPVKEPRVLATHLANVRFVYREYLAQKPAEGDWVDEWFRRTSPGAVRIEMSSLDENSSALPFVNITVPMRVTRDVGAPYNDLP